MTGKIPALMMTVQVEERYGSYRLVGHIGYRNEDGEPLNFLWSSIDPGAEYADFVVTAYIGSAWRGDEYDRGVWGPGYGYEPHSVTDVRHAEAIVKVMRKVERGLDKIADAEGWVMAGDIATHFLRVARVLKVSEYRVRQSRRGEDMTGEPYRTVDGAGLQSFILTVDRDAKEGKTREYVR